MFTTRNVLRRALRFVVRVVFVGGLFAPATHANELWVAPTYQFQTVVMATRAERHARGFTCWG
ncbi:MAG: hypothetical protein ACREKH_11935, partial [Candidatus Rokuibacteriota bacterium]